MKEPSNDDTVIPKHLWETSCFLGTRDLQMAALISLSKRGDSVNVDTVQYISSNIL